MLSIVFLVTSSPKLRSSVAKYYFPEESLMDDENLEPLIFKSMNFHVDLAKLDVNSPKSIWWKCDKGHVVLDYVVKQEGYFYCKICQALDNFCLPGDIGTFTSEIYLDESTGFFYSENTDIIFCELAFACSPSGTPKNSLIIPVKNLLSRYRRDTSSVFGKFIWICNHCDSLYEVSSGYLEDTYLDYSNLFGLCYACNSDILIPGFNDIRFLSGWAYQDGFDYEKDSGFDSSKNDSPINFYHSSKNESIYWTCYNGHSYENDAKNHFRIDECPTCSIPINYFDSPSNFKNYDQINKLLSEWDNSSNSDINPYTVKWDEKIWWRCSKDNAHPKYQKSINQMVRGKWCPYCSEEILLPGNNDIYTKYPHIAKHWSFKFNKDLDPKNIVYIGNSKKIIVLECDKGHIMENYLSNFRKSVICRDCQGGIKPGNSWIQLDFCKGLQLFLPNIEGLKGDIKTNIKWDNSQSLRVDMIDYSNNLIVEYDGKYYHSGKRSGKSLQYHLDLDASKTRSMLSAGFKVVRIRENDLDHLSISHKNLYQISHKNGDLIMSTINRIKEWLELS